MCDADPPDAFHQETRVARKRHVCCECRQTIQPGDRYQYTGGVWDHCGQSFKTCVACAELRDALYAALDTATGDCGPPMGGMVQYMLEDPRMIGNDVDDPVLLGWALGLMFAARIEDDDRNQERLRKHRSRVTIAA